MGDLAGMGWMRPIPLKDAANNIKKAIGQYGASVVLENMAGGEEGKKAQEAGSFFLGPEFADAIDQAVKIADSAGKEFKQG